MNTWLAPDDETARRLEQTLRQEADAMSIPDHFDHVARAARIRRQRITATIVGVAAGLTVIAVGGGVLLSQGGRIPTPASPAAPVSPASPIDPATTPLPPPEASPAAASSAPSTARATPAQTTPAPPGAPERAKPRIVGSQLGFASPTGNLVCTMDENTGARCHAVTATWSGKDVPAKKLTNCEDDVFGPGQDLIVTPAGSFGSCVTEISVFEAVETNGGRHNTVGTAYRTWAGPGTELVKILPDMKAYVLPYGTTAVTGRFSCTMAETGVTGSDSTTNAGFHLSRATFTLR